MGVPGLLPDAYLRLQSITRCLLVTSVYYLTPYGGPQSITRPLINSYYYYSKTYRHKGQNSEKRYVEGRDLTIKKQGT